MILTLSVLAGLAAVFGLSWYLAGRIHQAIATDHPPEGEFVEVNGTRLHYRRTGDPARPAVLMLHGAASNLEEPFMALSDALAEEHVIWLDRPGLGWSERPEGDWSPQHEADLIVRTLDALGVERATLIGHSWGGAIAMRTALDHPDRVDGLVLIAPALGAWIGEAAWFNKATFWPVLGPLISFIFVPLTGKPQLESGAVNAFHPEPVPEAYSRRSKLALLLRPKTWIANARDMARVNEHLSLQEPRYHDVAHTTVFLAGKGDTVLWSHRHSAVTASRMPRAEMRWLKGAGHNLHHHAPDAVAQAVRDVRD